MTDNVCARLEKPISEGVSAPSKVFDDVAAPVELDVLSAKCLNDLTEEYGFYTPALLHLTVPLTYDPFSVFCSEQDEDVARFTVKFVKPVFRGLTHPHGDDSWNYVLFAVAKRHFDKLMSWYGTCAFMDYETKLLRRIRTQNLAIVDPIVDHKLRLLDPAALVPVTCLVVESTVGNVYFKTDSVQLSPPEVVMDSAVYDDVLSFRNAVLAGSDNPYDKKE